MARREGKYRVKLLKINEEVSQTKNYHCLCLSGGERKAYPGKHQFTQGDFNFDKHDEKYEAMTASPLKDAYGTTAMRYAPRNTFNDFEANCKNDERIDDIWLSPGFKVTKYGVLTNTYANGLFLSDHFSVIAIIQCKKKSGS